VTAKAKQAANQSGANASARADSNVTEAAANAAAAPNTQVYCSRGQFNNEAPTSCRSLQQVIRFHPNRNKQKFRVEYQCENAQMHCFQRYMKP
jgi:hypothetical protein